MNVEIAERGPMEEFIRGWLCGEPPVQSYEFIGGKAVTALEKFARQQDRDLALARAECEALRNVLTIVSWHIEELREAWERGVMREGDNLGGTRSNRNFDVQIAIRNAITRREGYNA